MTGPPGRCKVVLSRLMDTLTSFSGNMVLAKGATPTHRDKTAMNGAQLTISVSGRNGGISVWATRHATRRLVKMVAVVGWNGSELYLLVL